MKSTHIKIISTALLTLLVLSILPATVLLIKPAHAQGTITLSSENFNPYKVVEIRVDIPGLTESFIELQLLRAGQPVELKNLADNTTYKFKAIRVATGVYYAYLGGNMTNLDNIPKYPKMSRTGNEDAFVKINYTGGPTTFTIEVLGYGITKDIAYTVAPSTITLDRTSIPIRRSSEFKITLTLADQDLNFDPTAVDKFTSTDTSLISLRITHINGTTGESKDVYADLGSFTISESAANSGRFAITFTVQNMISWLGISKLGKDDTLIFRASSNLTIPIPSGNVWGGDTDYYDTKMVKATYTYPKISLDFTQQRLKITIDSPDDNVDTGKKDNLEVAVNIAYAGRIYSIPAAKFTETGVNTGVFEFSLPVVWNTTRAIDTTKYHIGFAPEYRSFSVEVTYLDISASATYSTVAPEIDVVKATPKIVQFTIKDRDLNIRSGSVEYLSPKVSDNTILFNTSTGYDEWVTLYKVYVKDDKGRPINLPPDYRPSFFETDLNSGIFNLMLPAAGVFEAGKTYIIDIVDRTGVATTVTKVITIMEVKVELDRAVYPVNATTGIKVYITYYNDTANVNPTARETIPSGTLKYNVTDITGAIITNGSVDVLRETGPDTGVFEGSITLNANTPKWIDAKLVVYVAGNPDIKAEAVFKPYALTPADMSVAPAQVNLTGCFKVTVNDPDADVDSRAKNSFYVNVAGSKGTKTLKLTETGVNTGVFEGEFCDVAAVAKPGDTIKVEHVEKTPVLTPDTPSFTDYEYSITATVKVLSFSGTLEVPKDWIGPYETMTITVTDPDLNVDPAMADSASVRVAVEGVARTIPVTLTETGVNTGVFKGKLNLPMELTGSDTPAPDVIGQYIGRKVTIVYIDETDATGSRATIVRTLTIRAVDAEILVDKTAVNIGDTLKITIKNADIAQNPAATFRRVMISSTTYPTGITLYALEVEPGVYETSVKVTSLAEWVIGAPEIPAKLGDTITIAYEDPIAADGKSKTFTRTVAVGIFVEMPGRAEKVRFVDVVTGAEVAPKVGREVFLTVTLRNTDIVERGMTAIVVVRDPAGVAVARFAAVVTLGAGASTEVSFGWTPIVSGSHTVEVYIVKSLADRTPVGEPA
ncbi:MAG: hypothetical protein QXL19_10570, partial [Ignisphaera sp.]